MKQSSTPLPVSLGAFVDSESWTFAKTMPLWPHEYLVRERVGDEDLFVKLIEYIRSQGYLGTFYRMKITYYPGCTLKATADKLTGSYVALKRHAPSVLKRDGLNERIPTCDAVDYFAKALKKGPSNDAEHERAVDQEVVDELRAAVFEEGAPVTELRKRFNPVFNPKPEGAEQIAIVKASSDMGIGDEVENGQVLATIDSPEMLGEDLTELLERTKAQYAKSA